MSSIDVFKEGMQILDNPNTAFMPTYCLELQYYDPDSEAWVSFKRDHVSITVSTKTEAVVFYFNNYPEAGKITLEEIVKYPSNVLMRLRGMI